MSFTARAFKTENLEAPKANGSDSAKREYDSVRLNQEISIGKTAPAGTAKELILVPVRVFRAITQFGASHGLVCLDPESGTEGVLYLNTRLVEFTEKDGRVKHFVAGNFDGNALTTFCVRTSPSVDNGYDGEYEECDGEWTLNPEFYGKPIYIVRKSINKKNSKKTYQVMEWRACTDIEFPDLAEYLVAYEDREAERGLAAEGAAVRVNDAVRAVAADLGVSEDDVRDVLKKGKAADRKAMKAKAPVKAPAKVKVPAAPKPTIKPAGAAKLFENLLVSEAAEFTRMSIGTNKDPKIIAFDLSVEYGMSENDATQLIAAVIDEMATNGKADEPDFDEADEPADPAFDRALCLFRGGMNNLDVADKLDREFAGIEPSAKVAVMKRAKAAFRNESH